MDKIDSSAGNEWRAPNDATAGYWVERNPETSERAITISAVSAANPLIVLNGKPVRGGSLDIYEDVNIDELGTRVRTHGFTSRTVICVTDRDGNELYRAKASRTRYEIGYRKRTRRLVHMVTAKG